MSKAENFGTVGIVGGGNMGGALAGGLLAGGWRAAVAERAEAGREKLRRAFPDLAVVADSGAFPFEPDLLILAVKPNQLRSCCEAVRAAGISRRTTVASVAAGARWRAISEWLGGHEKLARAMPNTPALIGLGMTACFAPPTLGAAERDLTGRALGAVGEVLWVDCEAELDALTALSGCGPAYGYLLAEAMAAGGTALGLGPEIARRATAQTLRGAAEMLIRGGRASRVDGATATESAGSAGSATESTAANPADLRRAVTSPGGATAAALEIFARREFMESVAEAMRAAQKRAAEIGDELERNGPVENSGPSG